MSGSLHFEPILAASGIEFLVVLLIMAASAIFNWFQKRKNGQDDWSNVEKPTTTPKPGKPASAWEEELRRMLEGDAPTPSAPTPPVIREQPRPVIREQARPVPPPHPFSPPNPVPKATALRPPEVHSKKIYRGHCEQCEGHIEFPSDMMATDIRCPHCNKVTRLYPHTETVMERRNHKVQIAATKAVPWLEKLKESQRGRPSAFSPISKPAVPSDPGERKKSAEIQQVVSLLGNPRTARQAIIASTILNPPKAME